MIKRFFTLFSAKRSGALPQVKVISREEHGISRRNISSNALKVMQRLNQANFDGYLVGGSIRDLLLDGSPKDFDIATDATPEQVKALFRNSRIIGRRFKIVHVRFGKEIIEVTTFRGQNSDSNQQIESDTGQLLRDNVYGNLESDALRRDFTINALYYSEKDFTLHDYTGGLKDIHKRQLRMIGNPVARYTEDPVRLLRVIRFAAKLSFDIEEHTAAPIRRQAQLLTHVAPARLFDEILKLFLGGYATVTYTLLSEYDLLSQLFPCSAPLITSNRLYAKLVNLVMVNTDKRVRSGKRVTPAFIYAALLWPVLDQETTRYTNQGLPQLEAFHRAKDEIIEKQLKRIMIPKRFLMPMYQIWELQWKLPNRQGKKAYRLLEHPKFRAAYDFLLLREDAGERLDSLGQWWEQFQDADSDAQESMIDALKSKSYKSRRRRAKPSKSEFDRDSRTPNG